MRFGGRVLSIVVASLAVLLGTPGAVAPAHAASATPNGSDVLKVPTTGVVKHLLVVFLAGTAYTPARDSVFLERSRSLGFHTLGLAYVNHRSIQSVCGRDSACFGSTRREIVYGQNLSKKVSVSAANSVVGRLKANLKANPALAEFRLNPEGEPDWAKIVVSGHSQGAGHAAVLGIDKKVARVALLGGPNDRLKKSVPAWVQPASATGTPAASWFGLAHADDNSYATQRKAWDGFRLPTANRQIARYAADDGHLSLSVDDWLEPSASKPAVAAQWRALLGG